MTLDWVLFWMAIAHSVAMLASILGTGLRRSLGWAVKCAAVLLLAGLSSLLVPDRAFWITGGAWLILVAVPSLLAWLANRSALRGHHARAWHLARLVRWLHPVDEWRGTAAIMRALALAQGTDTGRGVAELSRLLRNPKTSPRAERLIRAHLCRLAGEWEPWPGPATTWGRSPIWRLASAIFLHFGAAHLILNMVALAAIGIWVARMLGHRRTLLIYLVAASAPPPARCCRCSSAGVQ